MCILSFMFIEHNFLFTTEGVVVGASMYVLRTTLGKRGAIGAIRVEDGFRMD